MEMSDVHLVEVYCTGSPNAPHKRRYIARMVRTLRMDDSTGWAVARDGGRRHIADQIDQDRDRLDLRCRACNLSAQVIVDETRATRGYDRLVQGLSTAARAGLRELPLHALAGIVSK